MIHLQRHLFYKSFDKDIKKPWQCFYAAEAIDHYTPRRIEPTGSMEFARIRWTLDLAGTDRLGQIDLSRQPEE